MPSKEEYKTGYSLLWTAELNMLVTEQNPAYDRLCVMNLQMATVGEWL